MEKGKCFFPSYSLFFNRQLKILNLHLITKSNQTNYKIFINFSKLKQKITTLFDELKCNMNMKNYCDWLNLFSQEILKN